MEVLAGSAGALGASYAHLSASESGVQPRSGPRLDKRTQLDQTYLIGSWERVERWAGTVYPGAGEATMWELRADGALVEVSDGFSPELVVDFLDAPRRPDNSRGYRPPAIGPDARATTRRDDAGADENRERVERRRRDRVRRWCVANKATRLGTLTYRGEGQRSWGQLQRDVARFRRQLRSGHPQVALLTAAEWHPKGHGWHVHLAMSGYVPKAKLAAYWGQGFVDVRKIRSAESGREAMRQVGRYLAKYLSKDQEGGERPEGAHAYEVTQGTQPTALRVSGLGYGGVYAGLVALLPGPVGYVWDSGSVPDWRGPPAAFLSA